MTALVVISILGKDYHLVLSVHSNGGVVIRSAVTLMRRSKDLSVSEGSELLQEGNLLTPDLLLYKKVSVNFIKVFKSMK